MKENFDFGDALLAGKELSTKKIKSFDESMLMGQAQFDKSLKKIKRLI